MWNSILENNKTKQKKMLWCWLWRCSEGSQAKDTVLESGKDKETSWSLEPSQRLWPYQYLSVKPDKMILTTEKEQYVVFYFTKLTIRDYSGKILMKHEGIFFGLHLISQSLNLWILLWMTCSVSLLLSYTTNVKPGCLYPSNLLYSFLFDF